MRHGFLVGIVMLYVIVLGLQMIALGVTEMTDANNLGRILDGYNAETRQSGGIYPSGLETYTNASTGQAEPSIGADDMSRIATAMGNMAMLYSPVIFQGIYLWFWFIFCLPISLAFWIGFGLALFRGVSSG